MLFDPALTSTTDFVSRLEEYSLNHEAVSHHFLVNIKKSMAFGQRKTSEITLLYLTAYSHFTSGFTNHVSLLLEKLVEPSHKEILKENLEEEMGHYDAETVREIEEIMGGDSKKVQNEIMGVPHRDLYLKMLTDLETQLGISFRNETALLDRIVAPLIETKKDIGESIEALLGTLYFSSELIVPDLYRFFAEALRSSMKYTDPDLIFFLLHMDMDQDHAEEMRKIVFDHCKTSNQRLKIISATEKMLKARVTFYEQVIEAFDEYHRSESEGWKNVDFLEELTGEFILADKSTNIDKANVLDMGCRDGYLSRLLIRHGADKVIGIDNSREMIARANQGKISSEREFYIAGLAKEAQKVCRENNVFGNQVMVRMRIKKILSILRFCF